MAARTAADESGIMRSFDELLDNNTRFAATDARARAPQIPFIPNKQIYVITCVDPRVDPVAVLGLELGDAIVARNVGGRVTPATLADLAWISFLHEDKTPHAEWFELVVIHHTDCGSGLMADDDLRHRFAQRGFDEHQLRDTAVTDPAITAAADVCRVLDDPNVSAKIAVSGYVYDLDTGLLTEIVAPTDRRPLRAAATGDPALAASPTRR